MFLVLLLVSFGVLHLKFFRKRKTWNTLQERAVWALAISLFAAGLLHFAIPDLFVAMLPDYLPAHRELVYTGGGALLAGSFGVLFKRVRRWASRGVTGMIAAFLPANIEVALNGLSVSDALDGVQDLPANHWLGWATVPMQLLYMVWSWRVGRRS